MNKVSDCCGDEVFTYGEETETHIFIAYRCNSCGHQCDAVSKEDFLHQKIDSLQMELRDVKAKVATLEGEISTVQKFIRSQQTPPGRNPEE